MNYYRVDNSCEPCIGSFGANCSGGHCIEGYFGHGCKDKCNCTKQQDCDRIVGCTVSKLLNGYEISRSNSDLRDKILLVLLGILIGTVMSAAGYALKWVFNRRNTQVPNIHGREPSNYVDREEIFLPRVYDQPNIDDRSSVYCDVSEREQDETSTPNIYIECV